MKRRQQPTTAPYAPWGVENERDYEKEREVKRWAVVRGSMAMVATATSHERFSCLIVTLEAVVVVIVQLPHTSLSSMLYIYIGWPA